MVTRIPVQTVADPSTRVSHMTWLLSMVSGEVGEGVLRGEKRGDSLTEVEIDQAGFLTAPAGLSMFALFYF